MTDAHGGDLFDLVAITKARQRGDRRAAVLWLTRTLVIASSLKADTVERVEMFWKSRARGRTSPYAEGDDRPEHSDLFAMLAKLDPAAQFVRLPMAALHEVEWRGDARLTIRAAGRSYRIRCGSAYEAEREFDLLQRETGDLLRPVTAPPGLPRSAQFCALAGLALLLAALLFPIGILAGGSPPTIVSPEIRELFAREHASAAWLWGLRAALILAVVLVLGGLAAWRRSDAARYLVLGDSSTPMTMEDRM